MGESIAIADVITLPGNTLPPNSNATLPQQPPLGLGDHIIPSISTQSSSGSNMSSSTIPTLALPHDADQSGGGDDAEVLVGAAADAKPSEKILHVDSKPPNHNVLFQRRVSPRLLGKCHAESSNEILSDQPRRKPPLPNAATTEKVPHLMRMRVSPRLIAKPRPFYGPTPRNFIIPCPVEEDVVCGKICDDISGGQERIPIPAFNLVDLPPLPPMGYQYSRSVRLGPGVTLPAVRSGCSCKGSCTDPRKCACAKLNGRGFPYVDNGGGRLIKAKDVVFECGANCGCGPECMNRTSQQGLRFRLELFRTPNKGWAVRSRDSILSGSPVCEYTGVLYRTNELHTASDNDYIFHIDCLETVEGLDGRERRLGVVSIPTSTDTLVEKSEDSGNESDPEFCIDGCAVGGVARFINHSCDPNLFVQCVLDSHHDARLARVMLFAAEDIPPMQELTYDYGYALDSVIGSDGKIKMMPCHCGAKDCRKRLY